MHQSINAGKQEAVLLTVWHLYKSGDNSRTCLQCAKCLWNNNNNDNKQLLACLCCYMCLPWGLALPPVRVRMQQSPLALISCLLSLLQLLQSCGQSLLCSVQLLLHQLDASVQGGNFSFSLRADTHTLLTQVVEDLHQLGSRDERRSKLEPQPLFL